MDASSIRLGDFVLNHGQVFFAHGGEILYVVSAGCFRNAIMIDVIRTYVRMKYHYLLLFIVISAAEVKLLKFTISQIV